MSSLIDLIRQKAFIEAGGLDREDRAEGGRSIMEGLTNLTNAAVNINKIRSQAAADAINARKAQMEEDELRIKKEEEQRNKSKFERQQRPVTAFFEPDIQSKLDTAPITGPNARELTVDELSAKPVMIEGKMHSPLLASQRIIDEQKAKALETQNKISELRKKFGDATLSEAGNLQDLESKEALADLRKKGGGGTGGKQDNPMPKLLSDRVYKHVGIDPTNKPLLTYRQGDVLFKESSRDMSEFFRDLGADITLGKDFLGEISPEEMKEIVGKRREREIKKIEAELPTTDSVGEAFKSGKITESEARDILFRKFKVK